MNLRSPSLLFSGLALAGFSAPAFAQDAIVPDDFATIQQAVLGAVDLDGSGTVEIFVRAGTYAENVLIQRSSLELAGEGAASTTIQGSGLGDALRVQDADFVTIKGFRVSNAGFGSAIELQRTDGCAISSCTAVGAQDGITANNSTNAQISSNECSGNAHSGIKLGRSSGNTVSLNDCHDNLSQGVDLAGSNGNVVSDNVLTGNGSNGLRVRFGTGNQILGNTSTGNLDNGFFMRRNVVGNVLMSNTASGNLSNGLRMRGTTANLITLNSFTGNVEFGVRRRNWTADDFDGAAGGVQDPAGDNDLSGNGKGPLRED